MNQSTSKNKHDGLTLFEESVLKPDHRLRQCARNQGCYDELMQVRERVLEFVASLRKEVTD
jgi:hypothetical protein